MTIELSFYTTDGCHLCEEATALLRDLLMQSPEQYQIEVIDIAQSDALIEQYGTRIPVVSRVLDTAELGWPFDYQQLLSFMAVK